MLPQSFYSTDQIERHSYGHTHFFDADSKRFFNSRIGDNAYPTPNPFVTLFTTSERNSGRFGGPSYRRKYTVRAYDSRTHDIDTVGEFQDYASSASANRAAKQLAADWEYPIEDMHEYALALNEEYNNLERRAIKRGEREFYFPEIAPDDKYIPVRYFSGLPVKT